METIAISKLRANLMKVLKRIEHGSSITITSRGKEVAKLVPLDYNRKNAQKRLKELRKTAVLHDVISPVDEDWEVMK